MLLRPLVEAMAAGFLGVSAGEQAQRLAKTLPCPTCGRECPRSDQERALVGEQGPFTWWEPVCHCEHCERSFFPSADRAKIDQRRYGPVMIDKITFAGTRSGSWQKGARALEVGGSPAQWKGGRADHVDQQHVPKLVREIKRQRGEQHEREVENSAKTSSITLADRA